MPDHPHNEKCRRKRTGFTLFELLIVLGVILLIAGIIWPNLLLFLQTSTLRDHSRMVADTIAQTRLAAIDNGLPYQFFYEPDGTHYLMLPTSDQPASGESNSTGTVVTIPGISGVLPEGYSFKSPDGIDAGQASLTSEMLKDVPDAGELQGVSWAAPAMFFPDGTGTDFAFELENDNRLYISFSVRSLTGAAKVSPIQERTR